MLRLAERFYRDDSGATAIEYALIASGVSLVIFSTIGQIGTALVSIFGSVNVGFAGH